MSGIKEIPDLGLGIWNTGSQVRYLKKNSVFEIPDPKKNRKNKCFTSVCFFLILNQFLNCHVLYYF